MAVRIGELLLKEKRITVEQLQEALNHQRQHGGKLGLNLIKLGFVKDSDITALLSKQYGVPSISLAEFEVDPAVVKLVSAETAQKYQIVPLARSGATLTIAMIDPTNVFAMDDIRFMTGYNVEPVVASEIAVLEAIERYYAKSNGNGAAGQRRHQRARSGEQGAGTDAARRRRRRRRGPRGARGDQRRDARQAGRRGADHQARERASDVGDPEGCQRHSHRARTRRSCASATAWTVFSTTSCRRR